MTEPQELYHLALNQWGVSSQLDMVVEECAELIKAIQKSRRHKEDWLPIIEEAVDVGLMIEQLKVIYPIQSIWEEYRVTKLKRLKTLLEITSKLDKSIKL
jgi:hypothetical protein